MNTTRRCLTCSCVIAALVFAVVACGTSSDETAVGESSPESDAAANDGAIAPPPPGSGAGAAGLGWTAPAGWVEEPPANAMRRAQYRVGDGGTCVVYYFGPGEGGDAQSNAKRWADQFEQPDGRSSREVMLFERIEVAGIPITLVEVSGTYNEGVMGGAARSNPGFKLLGAIAEGPDANWFFKFTGPESTLNSEKEAFRTMVESLQRGG